MAIALALIVIPLGLEAEGCKPAAREDTIKNSTQISSQPIIKRTSARKRQTGLSGVCFGAGEGCLHTNARNNELSFAKQFYFLLYLV